MVKKQQNCQPGQRVVFVRNIAARGLLRDFTVTCADLGGEVEVRRSFLPFFFGASTERLPLTSGMTVRRKFFDASFELAIIAQKDGVVTLS